ncbi:TetR/AcrR family transcriptional regulator [Rhodococcus sp. D2-41]|uniref:TetR/AcrR family transcriptional regulator n=1 Tax=Speluncibacter jeojiensis TaxID=2710754 RepID=UPI00240EB683|nr:TetR/AcrR family transcriptional regulator [Rhodococcus sp. D2-41]MDG3009064.1 TetR/AcrR family transcriptional regulator [Rhodococcus sp. D2-41]
MTTNPLLALLGADESGEDTRIIEAALEQFALTGVRRTSTDDIARRAGVNRATLYRRLGPKGDIVGAAFLYEAGRVLGEIESGLGDVETDDLGEYVVRFFTITLTALRENRLLHQLLEVDRDETLRSLTLGAGGVLQLASAFVAERIERIRERSGGSTDPAEIEALSGVLARLTQSLLLTPDGPPVVQTSAQMRVFAEAVLVPMITGVR